MTSRGALSDEEIVEVLALSTLGRIGCHAEGRTYVVPVTYHYDDGAVYGRTADGLKVRTMRANPEVCFEVEQIIDANNWRTVVCFGTYEELAGDSEDRALSMLDNRFENERLSETARVRGGASGRGIAFRIRLNERSGRFERG